jgi:hypothetical protein
MDKELVDMIRNDAVLGIAKDPLLTEMQYTELVAAGVFGDQFDQQIAIVTIKARPLQRQLARERRGTVRFRK